MANRCRKCGANYDCFCPRCTGMFLLSTDEICGREGARIQVEMDECREVELQDWWCEYAATPLEEEPEITYPDDFWGRIDARKDGAIPGRAVNLSPHMDDDLLAGIDPIPQTELQECRQLRRYRVI